VVLPEPSNDGGELGAAGATRRRRGGRQTGLVAKVTRSKRTSPRANVAAGLGWATSGAGQELEHPLGGGRRPGSRVEAAVVHGRRSGPAAGGNQHGAHVTWRGPPHDPQPPPTPIGSMGRRACRRGSGGSS
jgi:hypothetical protein